MITSYKEFKKLSESLQYHHINNIDIVDNIFRHGSNAYIECIKEVRHLFENREIELSDNDRHLYETTDIGYFGDYEGTQVPLDLPMEDMEVSEALYKGNDVELNKPKRGGIRKKYYVYVRNPETGNVKKIEFGDMHGGLSAKVSDPDARKAFAARHKCDTKKDKMKAGYWACRLTKYPQINGGKTYPGYW